MNAIKYCLRQLSGMTGGETFILGALIVSAAVGLDTSCLFDFGMGMCSLGLIKFAAEEKQK